MSFTKKYVPRQLQNIFDRISAKNEREINSAVSNPLPDSFEVIIYDSVTPHATRSKLASEVLSGNAANYFYYRGLSLAGHHDHLPKPETAKSTEEYERFRNAYFQAIIPRNTQRIPTSGDVYSATYLGGNLISLDSLVRAGSVTPDFIVEDDGAKGSFNNSTEPVAIADDYATSDNTFETLNEELGYSDTTTPQEPDGPNMDVRVPSKPSVGVTKFIDKLKASPSFAGFSAAALAGVVANAQAESNYIQLAAGDDISSYKSGFDKGKVSKGRMDNVNARNVNSKCSWGYWQLNICPDDGAGKELVDEMGIDITTIAGKKTWVRKLQNDEFQFAFVAKKISAITDINTSDPYQAGYDITVHFEKPKDYETKGIKRGNKAKQIFERHKDRLTR